MNQFEKKKEILKLQTVQRFVENATVEDEKGREKPLAKVVDIVFRAVSYTHLTLPTICSV